MSTSVAIIEPAFVPGPLTEELPNAPARIHRPQSRWDAREAVVAPVEESDPEDDEPTERRIPERRANLGYCILLSAVEDYRRANGKDFESAKLFLFPESEDIARNCAEQSG
jgi:hypothetical protein